MDPLSARNFWLNAVLWLEYHYPIPNPMTRRPVVKLKGFSALSGADFYRESMK